MCVCVCMCMGGLCVRVCLCLFLYHVCMNSIWDTNFSFHFLICHNLISFPMHNTMPLHVSSIQNAELMCAYLFFACSAQQ